MRVRVDMYKLQRTTLVLIMIGKTSKWPHGAVTRSTGLRRVCWRFAIAAVKCPLLCHLTTLYRTTCVKLTWTFQKWVLPGRLTLKWPWFETSSNLADLRCWKDVPGTYLHKLFRCANVAVQNSWSTRPKSFKWHSHFCTLTTLYANFVHVLYYCFGWAKRTHIRAEIMKQAGKQLRGRLWACLVNWMLLTKGPDATGMHFVHSICIFQLWLPYAEIQNYTCMTSWRRQSPRVSLATCLRKEHSRTSYVLLAVLCSHVLLTENIIWIMWTSKRPCKAL